MLVVKDASSLIYLLCQYLTCNSVSIKKVQIKMATEYCTCPVLDFSLFFFLFMFFLIHEKINQKIIAEYLLFQLNLNFSLCLEIQCNIFDEFYLIYEKNNLIIFCYSMLSLLVCELRCIYAFHAVINQGINAGDVKKLQDAGIYTCNGLMMFTKKVYKFRY